MSEKPLDITTIVRKRLAAIAREQAEDLHWVMTRYARERLLYRLGRSRHGRRFVLKGATLFSLWDAELYRPTRDIDLLGMMSNDVAALADVFREVCSEAGEDDGLLFLPGSVEAARITEEDKYHGVRVSVRANLGEARLFLQIDVGFGDTVIPRPIARELPTLLGDSPPPRMKVYPMEAVVAEKFQILVSLGMPNRRMKDFYDLRTLARRFEFNGAGLCKSIKATFETRRTPVPNAPPVALTPEFGDDETKNIQWNAFVRKGGVRMDKVSLPEVIKTLEGFLMPPALALATGEQFDAVWTPGGPWRSQK